jgi:hypothetical protein
MSGEIVLLSLDKSFNKVQYLPGLFSLRLSSSSIIFFLKYFSLINFNENNYNNIDSMVNDLNCIITEAANVSLK